MVLLNRLRAELLLHIIEDLLFQNATTITGSDFIAEIAPSAAPVPHTPLVRLKLVPDPQSPVVEVPPWLCFFQELARIENSVIGLGPDVTIHLPSRLYAWPLAD